MTTARYFPSGLSFTESGWPPRSIVATTAWVRRSITLRWPLGAAKDGLVSTLTSAYRLVTATDVGLPPTSTVPPGRGSDGRRMSTKPATPCTASV